MLVVLYHESRDIRLVVHGDDFTALGRREDLIWYETELARSFEIKVRGHLGEGKECVDEMKILNRVVRLSEGGLLYEADPRHAEMLVKALTENTNTVATPGDKSIEVDKDAELFDPELDGMRVVSDDEAEAERAIYHVRVRAVYFDDDLEVHEVPAYSTHYGAHPRSFVIRRDGSFKPLTREANPYTGKSSRVMQSRHDRFFPGDKRSSASSRRHQTLLEYAEFGNRWERHEKVFAVRTPSAKKKWERKSRQGARRVRKLELAEGAGHELSPEDATLFRAMAARANYMSQDRPDCSFVAKELCREFAVPTRNSFDRLERLCRYLLGVPRLVFHFPWQPKQSQFQIWVDTDFAGCKATRRSTSGGVIMAGKHCLRHWSTTQSTIALSSAEAELHGISKGAAQGIGLRSVARDLGLELSLKVLTDAAAAIGIVRRRGLGKVRHLDVTDLWLQERVRMKDLEIDKVDGTVNMADALTKVLARPLLVKHLIAMNVFPEEGRAASAPKLPPGF